MRRTVRFGAASFGLLSAAGLLLLARCTGTSIDLGGPQGSVGIHPPDDPAIQVQPTWEVHPTMLPTKTATPIA
jgi:hypothetical protein